MKFEISMIPDEIVDFINKLEDIWIFIDHKKSNSEKIIFTPKSLISSITIRKSWVKYSDWDDYLKMNMSRKNFNDFVYSLGFSKAFFPRYNEWFPKKDKILDFLRNEDI